MKKLFREIDFGQAEKPKDDDQVDWSANKIIIAGLVKEVEDEIINIKQGTSKFRKGAMHLDKGTCPAVAALNAFKKDQTPQRLELFLVLAQQDFGATVGDEFRKWAKSAFKMGKAKPKALLKKGFNQAVKDGLLDLFRSGMVTTVNTQQYEKMERHALQVSAAISDHTIGMLKRLQEAAVESVKYLEAENKQLKARIEALEGNSAGTSDKLAISLENSDN